jgi:ubiquinone/menaquinone biosynthesis C-methylase UbiE/uncharacterized protein YbaR (Trm112 family)
MIEKEMISLLACPDCKKELIMEREELFCKNCKRVYSIKDGIPVFGFRDDEAFWKEFFNDLSEKKGDSEEANAYFSKRSFEFTRDVLQSAIGKPEGKRIVDIGCGTGHASSFLSKNNLIIGVDISIKILFHARKKGLFPVQSSATKLPLRGNSFDLIICNNLLQTIKEGEYVLDEIDRITSNGGKIFISTANKEGFLNRIFSFIERKKYEKMRLYSLSEIESYLRKKNIKVCNFYFLSLPIMKFWKNKKSFLIKALSTSFIIEAEK